MKKFISIVLLITMLCGVLASCGKDGGETTQNTTSAGTEAPEVTVTTAATTENKPIDEPVVLNNIYDEPRILSGGFTGKTVLNVSEDKTLAVFGELNSGKGTITANVGGGGDSAPKFGLVFGLSEDGNLKYYRFQVNKSTQRVEIAQMRNNSETVLDSNYLSAGFGTSAVHPMYVIITDGKAYCYYWNTLYFVVDIKLSGTGVGIFSMKAKASFSRVTITDEANVETCDTLIFGHSYMEMWNNWEKEMNLIKDEYDLGVVRNIGIGGSVASHWVNFKEEILIYKPRIGIYDIGVNGLSGGQSPEKITAYVEETLVYLRENLPDFKVVLLSCSQCNARTSIKANISKLNELYRKMCAKYDWMLYAEVEYAFCDNNGNPMSSWFKDGLHPTESGYKQKYIPAITAALRGEDQPVLDQDEANKDLANAKTEAISKLCDYSQGAYSSENWKKAESLYKKMVDKINACKTEEEVKKVDLTAEKAELDKIENLADELFKHLTTEGSYYETTKSSSYTTFNNEMSKAKDGVFPITEKGYRIDSTAKYSDMNFTFILSDPSGDVGIAGPIFRVSQTASGGFKGYLINYVTAPNYIQVWYCSDSFASSNNNITYIGGWVFPGEVENTLFRAIVKNSHIYIYTEEDFQKGGETAYGCSVDLTNSGAIAEVKTGGIGILSTWSDLKANLAIPSFSGTVVE
ncbi:MAG: hypothetical protein J5850_03365 [Clostridia bacterium]|nr:hypothetical protein [Clostridia bacterium]